MKPETKQEAIDQINKIAKEGCDGIECQDCILQSPGIVCYTHISESAAASFLSGIEFEKNTFEKLKSCPQCGKPRGEYETGAFICPCPHCGDEVPF